MKKITSYRDIIGMWPSIGEFAADIGVKYVTAQLMKHRNSIGADHWSAVVEAARKRGYDVVTLELLAGLRSGHVPRPRHRDVSRAIA